MTAFEMVNTKCPLKMAGYFFLPSKLVNYKIQWTKDLEF